MKYDILELTQSSEVAWLAPLRPEKTRLEKI